MRAAGAHVSTYPGPLQLLVMCACHRTSPTAIALSAQWTVLRDRCRTKGTEPTEADELHGLPLRQRRNAADELHAGTLDRRRMSQTTQDCATVLATGVRAAVNEDSTELTEANVTHTLHNAAALAARYQRALPRRRAALTKRLSGKRRRLLQCTSPLRIRPHNAAVQPPHAALSSAQQAHNAMARLLRARVGVSRSAATAC